MGIVLPSVCRLNAYDTQAFADTITLKSRCMEAWVIQCLQVDSVPGRSHASTPRNRDISISASPHFWYSHTNQPEHITRNKCWKPSASMRNITFRCITQHIPVCTAFGIANIKKMRWKDTRQPAGAHMPENKISHITSIAPKRNKRACVGNWLFLSRDSIQEAHMVSKTQGQGPSQWEKFALNPASMISRVQNFNLSKEQSTSAGVCQNAARKRKSSRHWWLSCRVPVQIPEVQGLYMLCVRPNKDKQTNLRGLKVFFPSCDMMLTSFSATSPTICYFWKGTRVALYGAWRIRCMDVLICTGRKAVPCSLRVHAHDVRS